MSIDWAVWAFKAAGWIATVTRKVGLSGLVRAARGRAMIGVLTPTHQDVIHGVRRLTFLMDGRAAGDSVLAAEIASQVCTNCQKVMAGFLELPPNKLHCCIKLMAPKASEVDEDRVATWVRSTPLDGRPLELGDDNAHLVSTNTVWSALFGRSDGRTQWQAFPCFCCNDLIKKHEFFCCDRENWSRYYKSCLVFPIRYAKDHTGNNLAVIGFLAFDSPDTKAFQGLPDIYEYRDRPTEYRDKLHLSPVFHLGAIIADTMGACLGVALQQADRVSAKGNADGRTEEGSHDGA